MKRFAENGFTPLRHSAEHGFTLVEMIVALFIFALVAATGVALLTFSVRAQASAGLKLDAVADQRRMSALLTSDLAQAVPRVARDVDGQPVRAFRGNDGANPGLAMGYVRAGRSNLDDAPRAAIERVDIVLDQGRLERRSYAMVDGASEQSVMVLADRVESLHMRYRSKDGWRDDWSVPSRDALPLAVEITLKRQNQPALLTSYLVGVRYP